MSSWWGQPSSDAPTAVEEPRAPRDGAESASRVDTGPVNTGPVNIDSVETGPVNTGPVNIDSAETGPVNTGPAETDPAETGPGRPATVRPDVPDDGPSSRRSQSSSPWPGSLPTMAHLDRLNAELDDIDASLAAMDADPTPGGRA